MNEPLIFIPESMVMEDHDDAMAHVHDVIGEFIHNEWQVSSKELDDIPRPSSPPDYIKDRPLEEFWKEEEEFMKALDDLEIEDVMEMPYVDMNKLPTRMAFNKKNGIGVVSDDESSKPVYCSPCSETGHCMIQNERRAEDLDLRKCILLDSESTVHAFCNR